jgi:predicted ATPase/class 3 adenylate cyclase
VADDSPGGTLTFVFTDLESSTRLWEEHADAMSAAVARHDALLREVIEASGGRVVRGQGDGTFAVFGNAPAAVRAVQAAQNALSAEDWDDVGPLRARMAVHTGSAEERDGDYYGPTLNRAARLMAIGHGGQVLLSQATEALVRDFDDIVLIDLGEHRLRDLSRPERVYQVVLPGLPAEFPRLRSLDTGTTNLPVQLTSFVGRDMDVKAVAELLISHRLVTLTGVGGVGKTRLAVQAAAEAVERFADGVWLVELAPIDELRVADAIARVLGVEVRQGATIEASLFEFLGPRELLLVLDNCEHLVREVRRVTDEMLRAARGVTILATSREGLRVDGEQLFTVPSLDADAATRLFVERATAVDSSFALDAAGEAVVEKLCSRLDGVPLAIELAAARARMFSIEDLSHRVEQRFRLLTGGRGNVERHQTLRAAIDWSYDLLDESERQVFARMSVFAGGATLDAIEAVVADDSSRDTVVDVLAEVVDKSLVDADRTHAETRYEMLETIRQYAQERLVDSGDAEDVRARHARWYSEFARSAGRGLYSPDELVWDQRLQPEIDNLQIAVAWAAGAGETDIAMRIGGSFPRQATTRPLLGTAHLAEVALNVDGAATNPAYTRVLAEAAWAAASRGDASAFKLLRRSIDAQRGGARFAAAAFIYLFTLAGWENIATQDRVEIVAEGLALAEASGDVIAATGMRCAYASALMVYGVGKNDEAVAHAQRALEDARALGISTLEIGALDALAQTKAQTDPHAAIALLRRAIELGHQHHSESEETTMLGLLAHLEARYGNQGNAIVAIREKVVAELRYPNSPYNGYPLGMGVFTRAGRPDLVALWKGSSTIWGGAQRIGVSVWDSAFQEELDEARAALGDEQFDKLAETGAAMTPTELNTLLLNEIDAIIANVPGG